MCMETTAFGKLGPFFPFNGITGGFGHLRASRPSLNVLEYITLRVSSFTRRYYVTCNYDKSLLACLEGIFGARRRQMAGLIIISSERKPDMRVE